MSYKLTEKLQNLIPYQPVEGEFEVRLDANESFIGLPDYMAERIAEAVKGIDFNRYPDPYAVKLCKAYADCYGIDSRFVTAGNGSDELIALIMNSFFEKGDRVLTLAPDFSMYSFYISLAELGCDVYDKDSSLRLNIDDLIYYINTNNISGIIFSNPCNPTSGGVSADEVVKLIQSVGCLVILDEAYMDFWNSSILHRAAEFDNLIILRTCSKALGLAAIRLGFAVAGESITNALRAAKSPYNVSTLTQTVGELVLRDKEYIDSCIGKLIASRESLYSGLLTLQSKKPSVMKVYKPNTNFVLIETKDNAGLFAALKAKGIVVRYMGKFLRITAGTSLENTALLKAMEEYL